jgi:hypothetical protein
VPDARRAPLLGPIRWESVHRAGGGMRPLATLDARDDERFRGLVARVLPQVEQRLGPCVLANRAARPDGPSMLSPWRPARHAWRASIHRNIQAGTPSTRVVVTDVRDCYASIRPEIVGRALVRAGAGVPDARAVVAYLRALGASGVRGLPVGPEPSAVLANAVLAELDEAAVDAGCRFLRWVDDLVMFAPNGDAARSALDRVGRAAGRAGLQLHPDKTRTFTDLREARSSLMDGSESGAPSACMA